MYNSYYGLTFNPFDKQQLKEKDHFISRDFTEMINRLDYLKDIRGIGVFTARPGMGKSYALRCFASSLNPSLYHMEYLCLSTISVADFYKQLCSILGVPDRGGKTTMFRAIQEQIAYLYQEKHQPLLLAIDEAQYLNTGILFRYSAERADVVLYLSGDEFRDIIGFHQTKIVVRICLWQQEGF